MVFAAARLAGWLPDDVSAEHVQIGMMLGKDGSRCATRSGETLRLTGPDPGRGRPPPRGARRGAADA